MRATSFDQYGDTDVLQVGDLPDPKVGPGEALVEVRSASVNPVDWKLMADGLEPMMEATFPVAPGWDVAGVVRQVGPDTPEVAVGDEVLAYARKDWLHGGTFAELVTVPVRAIARKPAALSWDQAGALPLAVQIARELGAMVIGTASEGNHERLRELGATPVTYGDGLADRVREIAPDGVDAVADFVGGSWVWVRPDGAELQWLADLAARGGLEVGVAGRYGLDQVGEAFARSQEGHVRGKLVITVSEG